MPPSAALFRSLVLPRVSTTVLFWALRARSSRSRSGGGGLSARLSVHQGAALALARRGLSFQEKPAMPVGLVPVGNRRSCHLRPTREESGEAFMVALGWHFEE